jgi:hypothetical protein
MDLHVDLGQVIIASLIGTVGYFIKKEISTFGARLDRHETIIFGMAQNISTVIGQVGILSKMIGIESNAIEMYKIHSKSP